MLVQSRLGLAVLALSVVNAVFLYHLVNVARRLALSRDRPLEQYTFVDEDVPGRLPLPSARPAVHLLVEESVRYSLSSPEAELEWLYTATRGDGNVRLGSPKRLFSVALSHELHCLRTIRAALDDDGSPAGPALSHIIHCFNFLREHTLCAVDATLEPPDALDRDFATQRIQGVERRCADWPAIYDAMMQDYIDYYTME
ncbi:hypothetical protein OBBRIDRAFT_814804 [Obba rivulosa]|uniref:Uncharacterized protein n=1 Tax=Obba rivulosa TaxID=1052685 RepID=A0A8E2AKT6_9APHY|nr:hypothetical protein OBBRIDRAFT_814804 [Obba rivulosa]